MFANTIRKDVTYHGDRLANVEEEMKKIRDVMVSIARQEERMSAMDQRILAQGARIDELTKRISRPQ